MHRWHDAVIAGIYASHPELRYCYTDITKRDFVEFEKLHAGTNVYTSGFPCQPFSSSGRRLGPLDDSGNGLIVYWVI